MCQKRDSYGGVSARTSIQKKPTREKYMRFVSQHRLRDCRGERARLGQQQVHAIVGVWMATQERLASTSAIVTKSQDGAVGMAQKSVAPNSWKRRYGIRQVKKKLKNP